MCSHARRWDPHTSATPPIPFHPRRFTRPRFECQTPDCEFLIRTRDPDGIVRIATEHAAKYHDTAADPDRIRPRIED